MSVLSYGLSLGHVDDPRNAGNEPYTPDFGLFGMNSQVSYPLRSPDENSLSGAVNDFYLTKEQVYRYLDDLYSRGDIKTLEDFIGIASSLVAKHRSSPQALRKNRKGRSQFKYALRKESPFWGHFKCQETGEIKLHNDFPPAVKAKRGNIRWFYPFKGDYISVNKRPEALKKAVQNGDASLNYGESLPKETRKPEKKKKAKQSPRKEQKKREKGRKTKQPSDSGAEPNIWHSLESRSERDMFEMFHQRANADNRSHHSDSDTGSFCHSFSSSPLFLGF